MAEISGKTIIRHIMRSYADYGYNEFVIALGHKGKVMKDFFINYLRRNRRHTVRLSSGDVIPIPR
ncbi:MAG: hypothetical protein WAN11_26140 [Syntrophobacteraceae bacterium]